MPPGIRAWAAAASLLAVVFSATAGPLLPPVMAVLDAPVVIAPAPGSSHLANPELAWSRVAGATGYRIQVATTATFASPIYDATTHATRHVPSLDLDVGTLHWRVAALSNGTPQTWSASSFDRQATLGTPTPLSPADGAVTPYPAATVLTWSPVAGVGGYEVLVAGSSTINDQPIPVPTTSIVLQLADEPITWRVRAMSTNGRIAGPWSAERRVSASWDGVPAIVSPPDGGLSIRDAHLAWDPLPGARRYEVQVTPVPADWGSTRTISTTTEVPAYRFVDPHTPAGGEYAWRVRGVATDGMATAWTQVRSFEIRLSQPPDLLAPADGAVESGFPVLRWTPVARASHYFVDVSADPAFETGTMAIRTTEPELVASVSSPVALILRSGVTYHWRVRPIDDPGGRMASEPSAARAFTFSPPPVSLLAPADQDQVSVPIFSWDPGWASRYRLTIQDQDGVIVDQAETDTSSYTPVILLPQGPLRWRVEAMSHDGQVVNASEWRTVIIDELVATEPAPLITVAAGISGWVPPTLTWTPVVNATSYDVRFTCERCGTLNAVPLVYPAYTHTPDHTGRQRFDYDIVAYDADGAVIGVSEPSHFFWISPPYAEPLAPDGCAETCSVSDTPRLSWSPVPGADSYDVAIYRASDLALDEHFHTFATSFRPTVDMPDGSFIWRVRACAVDRCTILAPSASDQREFTKTSPTAVLSDPSDGAEFVDFVTLAWHDWVDASDPSGRHASEALTYAVVGFGGASQGGDGLRRTVLTSSSSITWGVRASFDVGMGRTASSPPSEMRTATIRRPAPVIVGPAAGSIYDYAPALAWSPRALAQSYELEVYRGDGSDLSPSALLWSATSYARTAWVGNELGAGTYAWRVRANLGEAGVSDWTDIRTFEVRSVALSLAEPSSGAQLQQPALTLRWHPVDRAEAYRVEISPSSTFETVAESVVTSQAAWIPVSNLAAGAWHWRVTPLSASALPLGVASARSFIIEAAPTPTPTPSATPTPAPSADPAAGVVDIIGHKFESDIRWLYTTGITKGCAPDRFCPDGLVTRAQMASFLTRALALRSTSTDYFTDDEQNRHEDAINRLRAAGITSGCSETRFCPSGAVTRGQMAAFLHRALR